MSFCVVVQGEKRQKKKKKAAHYVELYVSDQNTFLFFGVVFFFPFLLIVRSNIAHIQ